MKNISIGETIRHLRKEKNITQEQLSLMVGVSAGAVSKWETGNSTPDIALLSPLARALNTSLDTLLSHQQELSENEMINIKKELTGLFLHQSFSSGEKRCFEYLKEYPNSIPLKFMTAGLLQMYCMMAVDSEHIPEKVSEEFIKEKQRQALLLFEQVAAVRDPKYTPVALYCMANLYMIFEKYEESEKALQQMPQEQISPLSLYPELYFKQGKNDLAIKLCSKMLFQQINQNIFSLITLSNISKSEKDYDKAAFYLDAAFMLQDYFKVGMYSASYNYCRLCLEINDKEAAAKWFYTYVKGLLISGYDYKDNPYFGEIKLEVKPDHQKIVRKKLLQSILKEDGLAVLAGIQDYEAAIAALKEAMEKMEQEQAN